MQSGSLPYSGYSQASEHGRIRLYQWDCMELLKQTPDNYYGLCIVDPPYGLAQRTTGGGHISRNSMSSLRHHGWDDTLPNAEYFAELFRVSAHQIIWGGNYFGLPAHRTFIVWDKMTYVPTMSQVEQAWTSFDEPARYIQINSNQIGRIHPTQKPVALYRWILQNYAKPGQKILDTHGGSMSIAIACDIEGFDLDLCELDKDYFEAGKKRLEAHQAAPRLFDAQKETFTQLSIEPE
jgi:site-specific DNA-methyltransferase (adenine-specific)